MNESLEPLLTPGYKCQASLLVLLASGTRQWTALPADALTHSRPRRPLTELFSLSISRHLPAPGPTEPVWLGSGIKDLRRGPNSFSTRQAHSLHPQGQGAQGDPPQLRDPGDPREPPPQLPRGRTEADMVTDF